MRVAVAVFCSIACTPGEATPPSDPARVSVPTWAEGRPSAAPITVAVTKPTVSLGTDEPAKLATGKKIDLDVVAADLPNVCRLIGELAGVNIVVSDGVSGTVTVKMHGVPWNEALDAILLSKGYRAERVGSVIVVRPSK